MQPPSTAFNFALQSLAKVEQPVSAYVVAALDESGNSDLGNPSELVNELLKKEIEIIETVK